VNPNVGLFLHRWASADPNRIGIIDAEHGDLGISYAELDDKASRVAAHLRSRGASPGDRVAVYTDNGLEFVAAWFGAIYAGCATLPIPVQSTAREIAFRLQHASCTLLVTGSVRDQVAREGVERAGGLVESVRVDRAIATGSGGRPPDDVEPNSLAMLLYTSGTTGAAKCVCITHASLGAHTRALVEHTLKLNDRDRVLGTLPLTHSYGIRTTLLVPFCAGASTVFVPRFSPRRTLELCSTHEVTWLPGVPTMFIAWAVEDTAPAPSALRWCMSAGAPLMEEVRIRAEARLGAPVRQAYGLTEANLTAINAPPDQAVAGSSGLPVAGVEVRIESEKGAEVALGARGEVLVRGQNVMAGYLDDRLATAHVLRNGWLHTGDIGFVDEVGRLTIVDRSKDLILRGGASIYPSEVERVLLDHRDVSDAAVVGQPHPYYGEEVVAVVATTAPLSASDLDVWVRERLAAYKAPVRYGFVDALPKGSSGKTLKRCLRDEIADGTLHTELPRDGSAQ
jgi:long-chain acyl-CoA synthetase